MRSALRVTVAVAMVWAAAGCAMGDYAGHYSGSPGGEFGATQGGVQDMTLARSLVEEGRVPPADAFVVEGMFSEHDLPLEGPRCSTLLCLRGASGVAPDEAGESSLWVQIGLSSTIDPETYERPTQAIVATVDVSGSMGWSYPNDASPGTISRALLHALADRLGEGDRLAIVTFGSSTRVHLPFTPATDRSRIRASIDELREDGSTDMESGMRTAFPLAASARGTADDVRVMVLADYQPNVGATTPSEFQGIASEGAEDGVGLTLFGLGLGLGPEVMKAMSELRGGNAFSLVATEQVEPLFEDSWPWMVSPIAHDLAVTLEPVEGFRIAGAYGFPGVEGEAGASLEVASVFLSRRRGAMLLELQPTDGEEVAAVETLLRLSYAERSGESFAETFGVGYRGEALDERGAWFSQRGVEKTVALALLVTAMREAAALYGSDPGAAVERLEAAAARFELDAAALGDPDLDREVAFAEALLDLMRDHAPQGTFYPGY